MSTCREGLSSVVFDLAGHAFEAEVEPAVGHRSPVKAPMRGYEVPVQLAPSGRRALAVQNEDMGVGLGVGPHLAHDPVRIGPEVLWHAAFARRERNVMERCRPGVRREPPHCGQCLGEAAGDQPNDGRDLDGSIVVPLQEVTSEVPNIPGRSPMPDMRHDHARATRSKWASIRASASRIATSSAA